MSGIVGEVRVHLEDELVAVIYRPVEPGDIRGPEAQFAGPMDDVDPRVGGRELVGKRSGPVRRAVVDDEHLESRVLSQYLRHDRGEIVALVVGRDNDESATHGRASAPARSRPRADRRVRTARPGPTRAG